MQPAELRTIELVKRPDLVFEAGMYQAQPCWIVKDPISLKYYRLPAPEYYVLTSLNGRLSLHELKEALQQEFPAQAYKLSELHQLIASFQQQGMLLTPGAGQGQVLLERRQKERRQKAIHLFASALSLKFPGVDPDDFLTRTYPWVRWLFSRTMTVVFVLLMLSAGLLVLSDLAGFFRKLPEFQSFFSGPNLLLLGALLILSKTVHELGHAFVCKHFGGQCHEIGVMLLVLMPTLFCNTSDSWTMRNKWKRIAIGGAGMYVELILASICTWIWWFTQPSWLHYVCLNIMFLSSVSTILFNGNPLLRYDAYYMLSDFLEIPNLSQKSRAAMLDLCRRFFLAMPATPSRMVPQQNRIWFTFYSIASFLYRWFVVFSILWFLSQWFKPYGLEVIGHLLIGFSVMGMFAMPGWQLIKYFGHPARRRQVQRGRLLLSATGVVAALLFFVGVPLPRSVISPCLIQPQDGVRIYVKTPARILDNPVAAGQFVQADQEILKMDNIELRLDILNLQGEQQRLEGLIEQQQKELYLDLRKLTEIGPWQRELANVRVQLAEKEKRQAEVRLCSPRDGYVIPAHPVVRPFDQISAATQALPTWWGDPLSSENLGATLAEETQVCWIGDPDRMIAEVYVEQTDLELVGLGQTVHVLLDEYPGQRVLGKISNIAGERMKNVPPEIASTFGGPIEVKSDPTQGQSETIFQWYVVSVELEAVDFCLVPGFRGHAKIQLPPSTLAQRAYRWWNVMFRFR